MYQSYEYINFENFNDIESKLAKLNQKIKEVNENLPMYNKNVWKQNDFVYIEKVDSIEKEIEKLGNFYFKPDGWINAKTWVEDYNNIPLKSFSYIDINRWINNLQLLENNYTKQITLWDGISQISWNETTAYSWEE